MFISLPHGHAVSIAEELIDAGIKVIDLGADFRLKSASVYQQWYQHQPATESLLKQAVYGLPENGCKQAIAKASLVVCFR